MSALAAIPQDTARSEGWFEEGADYIGRALAVLAKLQDTPDKVNVDNCERSLRGAAMTLKDLWERVQVERQKQEVALTERLCKLHDKVREQNSKCLEHA